MSENKKIKFPHVYIILLAIVLITSLLTHLIPAGKYGKIIGANGKELIDAQSFEYVDGKGISLFEMLMSIPKGMIEVADIIFFIFIVGGAFYVVQATGAVENGIKKLANSMKGNEKILIPILTIVFALCGGIFGMAEETLPFIPIMVALSLSLGFDSLTGAGIVLAGAGAGFAGAFLNPFTIGVAQKIAGLEIYSGLNFRIGVFCCMTTLVIVFLYRYASKVKKAPELSLVYKIDQGRLSTIEIDETTDLSGSQKGVLLVFLAAIILLVYGVIQYGWGIIHIAGLFFGMGILAALVGRLGLNGFASNFVKGMANIAEGAMVVGVARAILVVLNEGQILDTILHGITEMVSQLPTLIAVYGMYLFQIILNFLIPSGGGQAAVSMPIMAPLSDILGISRQTAVLAYQFGDGISNIIVPTSGFFMAGLALAKIPWTKWAKWILPLILLEYLLGGIALTIAHMIGYQ